MQQADTVVALMYEICSVGDDRSHFSAAADCVQKDTHPSQKCYSSPLNVEWSCPPNVIKRDGEMHGCELQLEDNALDDLCV
jgi:hypothetical protein